MLETPRISIDREDPTPLHHQVRWALKDYIYKGSLKRGDCIPSEEELCGVLGVSRQTLRQAVDALCNEGVLKRVRPKGTFVLQPPIEGQLMEHLNVFEELRRQNIDVAARPISARIVPCPDDIASMLDVEVGSPVLELKRLYVADIEPLAFNVRYFPSPEFDWLLSEDLSGSWNELAERRHGIVIDHAYQVVRATAATSEHAKSLGVAPGFPLLELSRQNLTADDKPISYGHIYFRSDRYQLSVVLRRARGRAGVEQHSVPLRPAGALPPREPTN